MLVHHVVARHGDNGLEVLRMPLEGKGEALPVFSARWVARQYLCAEAPGGGWYARACPPDEMISLLAGPCAGVEWVALDPMRGRRSVGELANVMPRENFVDYLLCSRAPFLLRRRDFETIGDAHMDERTLGSGRQEALGDVTMLLDTKARRPWRAASATGSVTGPRVQGGPSGGENDPG